MSKVVVTFTFEPEPEEADDGDQTGLSEQGFKKVMDDVISIGGFDVEISKA